MMFDPNQPDRQDDSLQKLPALREGLASLFGGPIEVPSAKDQAIRREIRGHFSRQSRRYSWQWRVMPWMAAAALIAITIFVWPQFQHRNTPRLAVRGAAIEPADIDRSGRIDILDAFSLARQIEAGESMDAAIDLNHDGKIDAMDVHVIASKAVALSPGGSGAG